MLLLSPLGRTPGVPTVTSWGLRRAAVCEAFSRTGDIFTFQYFNHSLQQTCNPCLTIWSYGCYVFLIFPTALMTSNLCWLRQPVVKLPDQLQTTCSCTWLVIPKDTFGKKRSSCSIPPNIEQLIIRRIQSQLYLTVLIILRKQLLSVNMSV